jgi:lysophospholipase L1-like esterase
MRYAAIGDSFTEGLGDESADGSPRGWADLVAADMAGSASEPVHYANLAVRGRLMEPIVTGQLDQALSMAPTLITLNGGGNDMMRPRGDMRALAALTERAVRRCAESGVRLILLSAADPSDRLPLGRVIRRRATALTAMVAGLADKHRVEFVDVFNDTELRRAGYWSPDRLHLGPDGHRRVADLVLSALGLKTSAHTIRSETPDAPRSILAEFKYYGDHVLPWASQVLRERSSGSSAIAKHSSWIAVPR